jgi:signal transduction histidine kinase
MRLTLKFTLAFLLGLIAVFAVYGYVVLQRETEVFRTDMRRDNLLIGEIFAAALGRIGQLSGPDEVLDLVRRANLTESAVKLRWTWLDAPVDSPDRPRLPPEELEELARGRIVTYAEHPPRGTGDYLTYVPVVFKTGRLAALELAEPLGELRQYAHDALWRIISATVAIAAVSSLLALLLGFWVVGRPIHRLIDRTQRIAAGDFAGTLKLRQHDEIGQVADALNAMCAELAKAHERVRAETNARIAALQQLRHADRLRTVGQLTSGIAHEMGTPLNVIWGRAKMITGGELAADEAVDSARVIVEQSARMTRIIRQLLDFSRPRDPKKALVDLLQVVARTFALFETMAVKHRITLGIDGDQPPRPLEVDADQLQQVLSNLVLNAIQAMPAGGSITVRVAPQPVRPPAEHGGPEGEYMCLSVCDEGPGIPAELLPHIFEPFFSTKGAGEGTGLGLSVSQGIIREHGGWIEVESAVGEGTCFRIYLPQDSGACADAS